MEKNYRVVFTTVSELKPILSYESDSKPKIEMSKSVIAISIITSDGFVYAQFSRIDVIGFEVITKAGCNNWTGDDVTKIVFTKKEMV